MTDIYNLQFNLIFKIFLIHDYNDYDYVFEK